MTILTGLQLGYSKYCRFLCLWDSRARSEHYKKKRWPLRRDMEPGQHNVAALPLIPQKRIILRPLHIKLGLFKRFVKALDKDSLVFVFNFLQATFPKNYFVKIKYAFSENPDVYVKNKSKFGISATEFTKCTPSS